jgi:hypothetical protein
MRLYTARRRHDPSRGPLRSEKCAFPRANSALARQGSRDFAAAFSAWPGSRTDRKHDTFKPEWRKNASVMGIYRIAQPFRMSSTCCIKRGIGRRTSQSVRQTTKAQRTSRMTNALRPLEGAATGAAARQAAGADKPSRARPGTFPIDQARHRLEVLR